VFCSILRSYRRRLERLEAERRRFEEAAGIHLRTIEALAMAIEAKDGSSHNIYRVHFYATEIGRKMGLGKDEVLALGAAAILHDVGKLAIPEHLGSRLGKLAPEEIEKIKVHPVIGAGILERVRFPYAVAPIVRGHHERWDGTGYPDGLKATEIPVGARILGAVDFFDALTSERLHRRALTIEEAVAAMVREAGTGFDPQVVRILEENYRNWEKAAPVGQAASLFVKDGPGANFLESISAARQEDLALHEVTLDLGNSLNLSETLSVLDSRLHRLIPYDTMAVYVQRGGCLVPEYVNGANSGPFRSLQIPVGQALSGWVAETGKPIVNGNPAVEFDGPEAPTEFTSLRSALAVTLENAVGVIGVLTLYETGQDAFTKDHLRVLLAITPKVSLAIENALRFEQAAISANTDALTGLPNARALFLYLEAETSRARRTSDSLAVLVCDLDGFKQVNDRFGHLEGNRVLQIVAAGLRECCRGYDYVARMGGDEFVLVLPRLKPAGLSEKVKVLEGVAISAGEQICGERVLNLSVGAAFAPEHGTDAEGLLAEADRRMYAAKEIHKRAAASVVRDLTALAAAGSPRPDDRLPKETLSARSAASYD
jgi:diguanylate cyclase (GGDEF)-like protein